MERRAFALKMIASLGLAAAGCDVVPRYVPPLRLATALWPGYAPFYIARDRKLFSPTEIRIAAFTTDFDSSRAITDGRSDILCGTLFDILRLLDHGASIKAVHVLDFSKGADGVVARPGITKIDELRGKRVAAEVGTLTHFVLIRALEKSGVDEEEITLVNLAMDEAVGALEKGEVDAASLWEPFLSKAARGGARKVFSSAEIPGEILDVFAVQSGVLDQRPEDIERVLWGWEQALSVLRRAPEEVLPRIAMYMEMTEEELKDSLEAIEIVDFEQNLRLFDGASGAPSAWGACARAAAFMTKNKLLRRPPRDPEAVFEPGPLRRVAARRL